jgi:hypothetical protein
MMAEDLHRQLFLLPLSSSRHLQKLFSDRSVTAINLSREAAESIMAQERKLPDLLPAANFQK